MTRLFYQPCCCFSRQNALSFYPFILLNHLLPFLVRQSVCE